MPTSSSHRWQFTRVGGFDQVRLGRPEDLEHLHELDLKLWTALACPVKGLELDERTLTLLDTDGDGRIRPPEIIAAIRWCRECLRDLSALKPGRDALPIDAISDKTESGAALLAAARRVLETLGKPGATAITVADVEARAKAFLQGTFNGDGVLPPECADDPFVRAVIADAIACTGGDVGRSGRTGTTEARMSSFLAELAAYEAWAARPEAEPALRPLGGATEAAAAAWRAVRPKIDDWFARSRLAAYDARALPAVNRSEDAYVAVAAGDLSASATEVAGFPIAHVDGLRALPLEGSVNPAWAGPLAAFRAAAVAPLLGDRTALTADEWTTVGSRLAAHEAWLASKPATSVEKLGRARIREILASPVHDRIAALVAKDRAHEPAYQGLVQLEKLVRCVRDMDRLLHNYVNFAEFYAGDKSAIFQAGTLYLDARACELCVRVADASKHALLAGLSKAYLAYCDCTRRDGSKMTIAAAFTDGDSDYLMVGRNGVFFDREGRDWDATITKVVENPISVRQAFWSPYKKLVRMIEERVAKKAAAQEAENEAQLAALPVPAAGAPAPAAAAKAPPKKLDIGVVAALGVAAGALGTMLTFFLSAIDGIRFWQFCLVLAVILLLISGPSMLIAWLKLRQRNLAPILDANGWAVNGRVKMSVRFGGSMTSVASLPPGSVYAGEDPFAERRSVWPRLIGVVVVIAFFYSLFNDYGWIHALSSRAFGPENAFGSRADEPEPGTTTTTTKVSETETTVETETK